MVPSLNPKHFDCLWVINHTGYFLFRLKRIIGTGFCTLSVLHSDTSTLRARLQPGVELVCLPSHRNHPQLHPASQIATVSRKPQAEKSIKAPWKQGKGEKDRFQLDEQAIRLGFPFWDPGRKQLPTAKQL